jgi:adenylate kinase family enzyme
MPDLTRVVVVGTSGSGKTTFARHLAESIDSPHVELDALHWGPNWTVRADFLERTRDAAAEPAWVIDGNYEVVRDIVWSRATAIVWLSFSFGLTFTRAVRRTAQRVITGERLWWGNRETLRNAVFARDAIPWWVIRTHRKRRQEMPKLMQQREYAHIEFIVLNTPAQATAFLTTTRTEPCSTRLS